MPSNFNIKINFGDNGLTATGRNVVTEVANLWSQVIVGDLPDVNTPNIPGVSQVDDLYIDVVTGTAQAGTADGKDGTLASTSITKRRTLENTGLPYAAKISIDPADIPSSNTSPDFLDFKNTIFHEVGHALGFGDADLLLSKNLVGGTVNDPRFLGRAATAAYNRTYGLGNQATSVPLDNTVDPTTNKPKLGTHGSHWREDYFGSEMMTGFNNPGVGNPVSEITIGAFQDLGYQVNFAVADQFNPTIARTGIPFTSA